MTEAKHQPNDLPELFKSFQPDRSKVGGDVSPLSNKVELTLRDINYALSNIAEAVSLVIELLVIFPDLSAC